MAYALNLKVLIVSINILSVSVVSLQGNVSTSKKAEADTRHWRRLRRALINEEGKFVFTRNRRGITPSILLQFPFEKVARWLQNYRPEATKSLMKNAQRIRSKQSEVGKTVVFRKEGNYQTAATDFSRFEPYDIRTINSNGNVYGFSGKIRGNAGTFYSGKPIRIPDDESMSPELTIAVRFNEPMLEIFPSRRGNQIPRLKIRYLDQL